MKNLPLVSSPVQSRQVKQQFASPEDYLSYELGKAVKELPQVYTRVLAGSISLMVFGTIAWAHFSQVDEVAVASGEVIASLQVRPVRSLGDGTITNVKIKEGDRIHKGDILIERNPDLPQAEVNRLAKSTQLIREDIRRLEAERTGSVIAGTLLQDQLLNSRLKDFEARRSGAIAEANRQVAVINEAKVRLARLQENLVNAKTNLANAKTNVVNAEGVLIKAKSILANAQKREEGLRTLLVDGATPRFDYLDAQSGVFQAQTYVTRSEDGITNAQTKVTEAQDKVESTAKDIAAQRQQIQQAEQAYKGAVNKSEQLGSERQSEILTLLNKRREDLTTVEGQLQEARKQQDKETIKAPVDGTIYSVKATRGPVQAGEELLSILPEGEQLLLEVKVLNRDIGFIRQGMKAKVKMATFPFQEFGTIDGEVVQVSPNAIVDKDLGLVFPTRIKINKHSIQVRGKEVELTPGMSASGEIVTRKKSILTFITEPVTRRFSEAFSVR